MITEFVFIKCEVCELRAVRYGVGYWSRDGISAKIKLFKVGRGMTNWLEEVQTDH